MKSFIALFIPLLISMTIQAQSFKGKNWTAKKAGEVYIVSVANEAQLLDALNDFAQSQQITAGEVSGIGALNSATLRFFDPKTKDYEEKKFDEQFEISNAKGNVFVLDGKINIHLHATLGRSDYSALAGHLEKATVKGAAEFFFYPLPTKAIKEKDENIGLNIYQLED